MVADDKEIMEWAVKLDYELTELEVTLARICDKTNVGFEYPSVSNGRNLNARLDAIDARIMNAKSLAYKALETVMRGK